MASPLSAPPAPVELQPVFSLDNVVQDIQKLSEFLNRLNDFGRLIGTPKDDMQLRQFLKADREGAKNLSATISSRLQSAGSKKLIQPQDRQRYDKICRQYNSIVQRFRNIYDDTLRREREFHQLRGGAVDPATGLPPESGPSNPLAPKAGPSSSGMSMYSSDASLPEILTGMSASEQVRRTERAIIEENTKDMKEIEMEMRDIQGLFLDMAKIVGEQGQDLNQIRENLNVTVAHVETGMNELEEAYKLKKKLRSKCLCCCQPCIAICNMFCG